MSKVLRDSEIYDRHGGWFRSRVDRIECRKHVEQSSSPGTMDAGYEIEYRRACGGFEMERPSERPADLTPLAV
jgi:hypothetical protein